MNDNIDSVLPITQGDINEHVPRKTRAVVNGLRGIFTALLFLLFSLAFGALSGKTFIQQARQRSELRTEGKDAVGEIQRVWNEGRSLTTYVSYAFTVDGQMFSGKSEVPDGLEHETQESLSLPIRYLPRNPAVNHPARWESSADWETFLSPTVFCILGIVILLLLGRERKLLAEGVAVAGIVAQCSRRSAFGYRVKYEFRTKEGIEIAGTSWSGSPQEVGAQACVLYLAASPWRNQIYPSMNFQVIR